MKETIDSILEFWFGAGGGDGDAIAIAEAQTKMWWSKDAAVDAEIAARFTATIDAAAAGQLDAWEATPRGQLARIIVADQFPRNIHRDSPAAFAHDAQALRLAKDCVAHGDDQKLAPIQRVFAYIPFEHSESLADQELSLALYQALVDDSAGESGTGESDDGESGDGESDDGEIDGDTVPAAAAKTRELFETYLDFARRHHAIIARFGRFPHRNAVLNRESTAQELAFLQEPNSSF